MEINKLIEEFSKVSFTVKGVYYSKIKPGSKGYQKTLPFPGFVIPLRGSAKFHFNKTPYIIKKGNIIHGGANMDLDKEVLGRSYWEYITVLYEINGISKLNLEKAHFEVKVGQNPYMDKLAKELWEVYSQPGSLAKFQRERIFRTLLEEVFLSANKIETQGDKIIFDKISRYIHKNYMENFSISQLASFFHINENRLFYIFNKNIGIGAGEYLIKYRFAKAKELLVTTDTPIGKIGEGVGYHDPLHFSKMFKKIYGESPSLARKSFRKMT